MPERPGERGWLTPVPVMAKHAVHLTVGVPSMNFLPTFPVFAAYLVAVLVITFTPGPDMTLFLGKAVRQGTAAGMASMLGASTGVLIHTILVALGLSALLAASVTAFTILKVGGALYLLWLAVQTLRHGSALTSRRGEAGAHRASRSIGPGWPASA